MFRVKEYTASSLPRKRGDSVSVYRDIFPTGEKIIRSATITDVLRRENIVEYVVSWNGHEIVCDERDLTPPKKVSSKVIRF
jgi:hypothetical protein